MLRNPYHVCVCVAVVGETFKHYILQELCMRACACVCVW